MIILISRGENMEKVRSFILDILAILILGVIINKIGKQLIGNINACLTNYIPLLSLIASSVIVTKCMWPYHHTTYHGDHQG